MSCTCGCDCNYDNQQDDQLMFDVGEINRILAGSIIDCSTRYSCCPGQYRPLTLDEALPLVQEKERGVGKILTFLNKDTPPKLEIWAYRGQNITGWFNLENWISLAVPSSGKGTYVISGNVKEISIVDEAPSVKDNILYFEYEPLPEVSEYRFQVLMESPDIYAQVSVTMLVTLYTRLLGQKGLDRVRFLFGTDSKPANSHVTASATDSEGNTYTFVDTGYWGPSYGFNIPVEYEATTPFTVTFDTPGTYELYIKLIQVDTGQVIVQKTTTVKVK